MKIQKSLRVNPATWESVKRAAKRMGMFLWTWHDQALREAVRRQEERERREKLMREQS